jgi:glycosyltransferase involved in cell wall biosynthesis
LIASVVQRMQLAALFRICHRAFVTTETRQRDLAPLCRLLHLPLPSVVRVGPSALPQVREPARTSARIGVFSTANVGKRFDVILEAFEVIARERPDATLVLIGDLGSRDTPASRTLLRAIEQHPASARIRVTGKLDLEEVSREIQDLDVYLNPMETGANTRSSTLPTALGSGIPVVAVRGRETDSSLFVDRENVVFADALTGASLASAALEVLHDSALAVRVSAGGLALYDKSLSWPRIADRLLAELDTP